MNNQRAELSWVNELGYLTEKSDGEEDDVGERKVSVCVGAKKVIIWCD